MCPPRPKGDYLLRLRRLLGGVIFTSCLLLPDVALPADVGIEPRPRLSVSAIGQFRQPLGGVQPVRRSSGSGAVDILRREFAGSAWGIRLGAHRAATDTREQSEISAAPGYRLVVAPDHRLQFGLLLHAGIARTHLRLNSRFRNTHLEGLARFGFFLEYQLNGRTRLGVEPTVSRRAPRFFSRHESWGLAYGVYFQHSP